MFKEIVRTKKSINPSTAEEVTRIVEGQLASGNYRHVACNLCGSDDAVPYALRLGAGTPFVVHRRRVRCRKCGLIYYIQASQDRAE